MGLLPEEDGLPPADAPPPVPAASVFGADDPDGALSPVVLAGVVLEPVSDDAPPSAPLVPSAAAPPEDSAALEDSPVGSLLPEDFAVEVVEVVAVVLVRVASLSAEVLLGGVISGVLRGAASLTVLPPQALSAKLQSPTRRIARTTAVLRFTRSAGPSGGRRWGSR